MFWKGEIHVQTSRMFLLDKLRNNFQKPFLRTEANDSFFKLYDAISKRNWRMFHYYVIEGRLIEDDSGTIVKYAIIPTFTSQISAFIMLFSMLYLRSIGEGNEIGKWLCLIIVTANICFFIDLMWQAHVVKTRFEHILQT